MTPETGERRAGRRFGRRRGSGTVGLLERSRWADPRRLGLIVVAAAVLAGCGGGGASGDAAGGAELDGSPIEGPEPTPTAAPTTTPAPTPTPGPTATAEPAAVPSPTPASGPEAEVIAAWERYLRLSVEARGKDPSPEALDFDSYVWGDAKAALVQEIADDQAEGIYIDGETSQDGSDFEIRPDGVGVVELCIVTDWVSRSRLDDSPQLVEGEVRYAARARVDPQADGRWLVAATEFSVGCR